MKAKVFDHAGKKIAEFELPMSPETPKVICNLNLGPAGVCYQLTATGNGYEYRAVPFLCVRSGLPPVLYDAKGKLA